MASTISHSSAETFELGRAFAETVRPGSVIALCGEMGAGKTQFVKGLAAGLGFHGEVTSPTFTLVHEYTGGRIALYHGDFYRLESEADAKRIGLDDYFDGSGVVVIEWAEKFSKLLPRRARWVDFRHRDEGTREIGERE